jgi:hypothetical protein
VVRIRRFPRLPIAAPIQLVLGLDLVGIRKPKRHRKVAPAPVETAA